MNNKQLSEEFDTLINSYANQNFFGEGTSRYDIVLDEYEKSVYLTQAEKQFVIDYYSGRSPIGFSFEEKEEIRQALDTLVCTKELQEVNSDDIPESVKHLYQGNHLFTFFSIPANLLYIIFEEVKFSSYISDCNKGASALVVPATHDDLWHRLQNPFRGTSKQRVLRLNAADNLVELVSDYPIGSYLLRYVEEPKPIILIDLPNGLTIDGISSKTECKLPSITHHIILNNAVRLALQSKMIGGHSSSGSKD